MRFEHFAVVAALQAALGTHVRSAGREMRVSLMCVTRAPSRQHQSAFLVPEKFHMKTLFIVGVLISWLHSAMQFVLHECNGIGVQLKMLQRDLTLIFPASVGSTGVDQSPLSHPWPSWSALKMNLFGELGCFSASKPQYAGRGVPSRQGSGEGE